MRDTSKMLWILPVILLAGVALSTIAQAEPLVAIVPPIENLSEARAYQEIMRSNLTPSFQECYSNTVKEHQIIPGSQNPRAEEEIFVGEKVKAKVSLGIFPSFIGLSENEAKDALDEANLSYDVQNGRNSSIKDGYVFDQEPKNATCLGPDFKVRIYVNRPLAIEIESPKENDTVSSIVVVTGRVSSDLMENESLWIAVKPQKSVRDWWPQNNLPRLVPVNGEFEGNAFLGGNKGDRFEIAVLVVDEKINEIFMNWTNTSIRENNWPSITEGRAGTNQKVPKEEIEALKLAKVNVILNQ